MDILLIPSPRWKQTLAILISLCLLWTSGGAAEAVLSTSQGTIKTASLPQIELAPPVSLGQVTDSYNTTAQDKKLVVLIQDLHAHYGVQKNISGLLEFLTSRLSSTAVVSGGSRDSKFLDPGLRLAGVTANKIPFALAVEGASGPIDSSVMALFPDQKIKQEALDYLMKEGELTGMEYFAAMRGIPNLLVGVEDAGLYNTHRDLFRQTLADRQQLVEILRGIQADLLALKPRIYSKELQAFEDKTNAFEKGDLGTQEFVAWLTTQAEPLGIDVSALHTVAAGDSEQLFQDIDSIAFLIKTQKARTKAESDLVQVEHDLALLLKVSDLQATEPEIRSFGPRLNQFIALCNSLLKTHGLKELSEGKVRDLISTSIDYYVMALMRNKPMVENTLALLAPGLRTEDWVLSKNPKNKPHLSLSPQHSSLSTVVLVAGGFHTKPITTLLREKNISYIVITPTVNQVTDADHELYVKRLSGQLLTEEDVINDKRWAEDDSRLAKNQSEAQESLAIQPPVATVGVVLAALCMVAMVSHGMPWHSFLADLSGMHSLPGINAWIAHFPSLWKAHQISIVKASVVSGVVVAGVHTLRSRKSISLFTHLVARSVSFVGFLAFLASCSVPPSSTAVMGGLTPPGITANQKDGKVLAVTERFTDISRFDQQLLDDYDLENNAFFGRDAQTAERILDGANTVQDQKLIAESIIDLENWGVDQLIVPAWFANPNIRILITSNLKAEAPVIITSRDMQQLSYVLIPRHILYDHSPDEPPELSTSIKMRVFILEAALNSLINSTSNVELENALLMESFAAVFAHDGLKKEASVYRYISDLTRLGLITPNMKVFAAGTPILAAFDLLQKVHGLKPNDVDYVMGDILPPDKFVFLFLGPGGTHYYIEVGLNSKGAREVKPPSVQPPTSNPQNPPGTHSILFNARTNLGPGAFGRNTPIKEVMARIPVPYTERVVNFLTSKQTLTAFVVGSSSIFTMGMSGGDWMAMGIFFAVSTLVTVEILRPNSIRQWLVNLRIILPALIRPLFPIALIMPALLSPTNPLFLGLGTTMTLILYGGLRALRAKVDNFLQVIASFKASFDSYRSKTIQLLLNLILPYLSWDPGITPLDFYSFLVRQINRISVRENVNLPPSLLGLQIQRPNRDEFFNRLAVPIQQPRPVHFAPADAFRALAFQVHSLGNFNGPRIQEFLESQRFTSRDQLIIRPLLYQENGEPITDENYTNAVATIFHSLSQETENNPQKDIRNISSWRVVDLVRARINETMGRIKDSRKYPLTHPETRELGQLEALERAKVLTKVFGLRHPDWKEGLKDLNDEKMSKQEREFRYLVAPETIYRRTNGTRQILTVQEGIDLWIQEYYAPIVEAPHFETPEKAVAFAAEHPGDRVALQKGARAIAQAHQNVLAEAGGHRYPDSVKRRAFAANAKAHRAHNIDHTDVLTQALPRLGGATQKEIWNIIKKRFEELGKMESIPNNILTGNYWPGVFKDTRFKDLVYIHEFQAIQQQILDAIKFALGSQGNLSEVPAALFAERAIAYMDYVEAQTDSMRQANEPNADMEALAWSAVEAHLKLLGLSGKIPADDVFTGNYWPDVLKSFGVWKTGSEDWNFNYGAYEGIRNVIMDALNSARAAKDLEPSTFAESALNYIETYKNFRHEAKSGQNLEDLAWRVVKFRLGVLKTYKKIHSLHPESSVYWEEALSRAGIQLDATESQGLNPEKFKFIVDTAAGAFKSSYYSRTSHAPDPKPAEVFQKALDRVIGVENSVRSDAGTALTLPETYEAGNIFYDTHPKIEKISRFGLRILLLLKRLSYQLRGRPAPYELPTRDLLIKVMYAPWPEIDDATFSLPSTYVPRHYKQLNTTMGEYASDIFKAKMTKQITGAKWIFGITWVSTLLGLAVGIGFLYQFWSNPETVGDFILSHVPTLFGKKIVLISLMGGCGLFDLFVVVSLILLVVNFWSHSFYNLYHLDAALTMGDPSATKPPEENLYIQKQRFYDLMEVQLGHIATAAEIGPEVANVLYWEKLVGQDGRFLDPGGLNELLKDDIPQLVAAGKRGASQYPTPAEFSERALRALPYIRARAEARHKIETHTGNLRQNALELLVAQLHLFEFYANTKYRLDQLEEGYWEILLGEEAYRAIQDIIQRRVFLAGAKGVNGVFVDKYPASLQAHARAALSQLRATPDLPPLDLKDARPDEKEQRIASAKVAELLPRPPERLALPAPTPIDKRWGWSKGVHSKSDPWFKKGSRDPHDAEENARELWEEGHRWDALVSIWGTLSWYLHVVLFAGSVPTLDSLNIKDAEGKVTTLETAIRASLIEGEQVKGVRVHAMNRENDPGWNFAVARVSFNPETGMADVYVNTYASFRGIIRSIFHEAEHLKNPAKIGDSQEESRVIKVSYQKMHELDQLVRKHMQRTREGVDDAAQAETDARQQAIPQYHDPLFMHLFTIWHLHRENQTLANRTRESILGAA